MKILFICGSLEPGRDGVGDYIRRLAGELIRQGHQIAAVAVNDQFLTNEFEEMQKDYDTSLKVFRLPSIWTSKKRFECAKQWIDKQEPEWLSLHFVPYSFHTKGLPIMLDRQLVKIGMKYKWHIMFHELWLGIYGKTSLKNKIIGLAQRFIINKLISVLRPCYVTTTILIYKKKMSMLGGEAKILPLFGNIPVIRTKFGAIHNNSSINKSLTAVHFGSFTSAFSDFKEQLEYIKRIANTNNLDVKLLILGEGGHHSSVALKIARFVLGESALSVIGRLSTDQISEYMLSADLGISRADYVMLGKSGSTIAMLEHGLPVLLRGKGPTQDHEFKAFANFQDQIIFTDTYLKSVPVKKVPKSLLKEVAFLFTDLLDKKNQTSLFKHKCQIL